MVAQAHAAASNVQSLPLRRRSIEDALMAAARGEPPVQPHADTKLLQAEAALAREVFMQVIKPALRAALHAPQYKVGPEKDVGRVLKKKGSPDENCDWARFANLVNNMDMAKTSSDMLSRRGLLTLVGVDGQQVNIYIVDSDNTFTNPSKKKPGLRNIDTKMLVSLTLKNGEETYHILEMHTILAASADAFRQSHKKYEIYRQQDDYAKTFARAVTLTNDGECLRSMFKRAASARRKADEALEARTHINLADEQRNSTHTLTGYVPTKNSGKGWSFTSFDELMKMHEAPPPAAQPRRLTTTGPAPAYALVANMK